MFTRVLALLILLTLPALPAGAQRLATIYDSKPMVELTRGAAGPRAALVGEALYEHDFLHAQPSGRLGFVLADGSVARLEGGSELTLAQPKGALGTLLELAKGVLRIDAAKQGKRQLLVSSHFAVAGVKGTQYQVEAGDASTTVQVLEGQVELKALTGSASTLIGAGEEATSYPDRVDAARKLSFEQVQALRGAMKELVDQKKKAYAERVRQAIGKRKDTQEGNP